MPSAVIDRFTYDDETRTLFVIFTSGDLYAYRDVERDVHEAWKAAFSKGRFFSRRIRDRYAYARIEDPADARAVVFRRAPRPTGRTAGRAWPPRAGAGR